MSKEVVLTGLRTNAEYHIGNYLGAILPMVNMHKSHIDEYQINLFAPDLHSFTTEIDYHNLYAQTMANLKVFVAAGMPIDHDNFYMYRQSFIPAHSEMTLILNNFTYFGELSRMTQFKDKQIEKLQVTAGLFDYPVLMAADILLYHAKWVPVGEDQRQHLELARDLSIRMNNKFGTLFEVPETWDRQLKFAGRSEGVRIRSLRNPDKKMSKSIQDPAGTILLSDSPDQAIKKIKQATTDNLGKIKWDWKNQPGITNLLQIYEILGSIPHQEVLSKWEEHTSYGDLKNAVSHQVEEFLTKLQSAIDNVSDEVINRKLLSCETQMSSVANQTLLSVQKVVGLRQK